MTPRTAPLLTDNDMDIMRVLHNAFRRDIVRVEQVARRYGTEDPETHDAVLLGWHGFSWALHHHHVIEDRYIWPTMRGKLADHPDDDAVLDDMEGEHALIDPALEAVEAALGDRDAPPAGVADRMGELVDLVRCHLDHEEKDAFPLMRRTITTREWSALNRSAVKEASLSELAQLGPYVLEGASPDDARRVLAELPPPLRLVHRFWWNPSYRRSRRWE